MMYQFEHEEIDICNNCPMCVRVIDTEGCMLTESLISGSKTPQENDCPLVAIPKTETAHKMTVDVQLRPMLDDLEVDIDAVKQYISKLKENER